MAKRPSIGKRVDLHDECAAHGEDIPEAAVGMRPSRPPHDDAVKAAIKEPEQREQIGGF